jgi:hypothetical protein
VGELGRGKRRTVLGVRHDGEEWRATKDVEVMLGYVGRRLSERQLRLFGCAGLRWSCWYALTDERGRRAVEVMERYADRLATEAEREKAHREAWQSWEDSGGGEAFMLAYRLADGNAWMLLPGILAGIIEIWHEWLRAGKRPLPSQRQYRENPRLDRLLRDIAGNPFGPRKVVPESVLAWNGGTVPRLAEAIYDEKAFDRMPILADALEEAGCTDPEILGHCRGPGPLVRGCWVLDVTLAKR